MATLTLPGSCAAQVTAKDNADGWGRGGVAHWNTYFSWIFIYSLMIKKMQSFLCYTY